MTRTIFHVDMDAFFAAVEVLDRGDLAGKPLVVGGSVESHGVVAAASYEAREYGIRSGMSMAQALRRCPVCIRVPPRGRRYSEISRKIFSIVGAYTPLFERVSIDEGYLDLTGCMGREGPEAAAARLKADIRRQTGLTASVGAATNRLVAKIASDMRKPDGLVVVEPGGEAGFLTPLKIESLPGIGPSTASQLHGMGILTLGDLAAYPPDALSRRFGRHAEDLQSRAAGIDDTRVGARGARKSVSAERTLFEFVDGLDDIERVLLDLAEEVSARARASRVEGRVVTLKLRDDLFITRTRMETLPEPTDAAGVLFGKASELYARDPLAPGRKARLLGICLGGLAASDSGQCLLLPDPDRQRNRSLEAAIDDIRSRMGSGAIIRARLLKDKDA